MSQRGLVVVHAAILLVAAPALAFLLAPSPDLLTWALFWLAALVLVELAFSLYLWGVRKDRGRAGPVDPESKHG